MGRIRQVKPEFFKHEKLNDLEASQPHLRPMLTFLGVWGQCDANGVFRWRPRTLKLEILPFVVYEIEQSLELLVTEGFLIRFESNGSDLGLVTTWKSHQHVTKKEQGYTDYDRKYTIPGENPQPIEANTNPFDVTDLEQNGNDLNLSGVPTKSEVVKEQMLGEIWIEQACMVNGFDKAKFTEFIKTWIANKILTETITYPVKKLKLFVIEDYAKVIKSTTNGKAVIGKRSTAYAKF